MPAVTLGQENAWKVISKDFSLVSMLFTLCCNATRRTRGERRVFVGPFAEAFRGEIDRRLDGDTG